MLQPKDISTQVAFSSLVYQSNRTYKVVEDISNFTNIWLSLAQPTSDHALGFTKT